MKKVLVLLLALSMLLMVFAGCKNGDTNSDETIGGEEETTPAVDEWGRDYVADSLPEGLDFEGEEVSILVRDGGQYDREWYMATPTEALDQQIYERNSYVEETLNVEFNFIPVPCDLSGSNDYNAYSNKILNDYNGQLNSYDIVNHFAYYGVSPSLTGIYANLMDEELFPYFDFEKPWWNHAYMDTVSANGQLYYTVGSVCLSVLDRMFVMYYNETLGESYQLPDMYETVLNGDWTYDMLYELCTTYYDDLDVSNTENENDFYVFAAKRWAESYDPYIYAFDQRMILTNDDGMHTLNIDGISEMDDAAKKVKALFDTQGAYIHADSAQVISMFANRQLLFAQQVVWHYPSHSATYAEMTDDFGVLPLPKYDDQQTEYKTGVGDAYNIISVPNYQNFDGEMISAVLEMMNVESYRQVYPYYYEKMMKTRYVRNAASSQVFDLLVDSITFDFGDVFSQQIDNIKHSYWRNPCDNGIPVTRVNAINGETFKELLEDLDDWYLANR